MVLHEIAALGKAQRMNLAGYHLLGGGGGAPVITAAIGQSLGLRHSLIRDHTVISAIGAALAVTCVSLSRTVAEPRAADIAALTEEVQARLTVQGAERVSTDYDYDPQRQVLTVTGRGNRPYSQAARIHDAQELADLAAGELGGRPELAWNAGGMQLWQNNEAASRPVGMISKTGTTQQLSTARTARGARQGTGRGQTAIALSNQGRILWQGRLRAFYPTTGAQREAVLADVLARHMAYGDGGAELPGLALLADSRLIPLDHLGSSELIAEVLRLEQLASDAPACFIVRG
jgi:hypothetical protein